ADWAVHMRRVARDDGAPVTEFLRHALMHRVEVAAYDLEGAAGGEKALQALLHRLGRHQRVRVLVRLGRKMNAPALRGTLPVEQVGPFLGVGNVVAVS